MAHRTTQRRNLAAPDHPNTSTDPTHKKQPKSSICTTTTAKPRLRHHPSDRDPTGPSSTIHTISKHFSKLYTSHHHKVPSKPRIDTHLHSKPMAITSATEDTSSKPITKSAHQHRRTVAEMEKERLRASVTGAIDNNNNSWKESHHQSHHKTDKIKKFSKMESHDLKKPPASLLSRSLDSGFKGAREENYNQRPQFSLAVAAGGGGRRSSFCNSQTELADFFSCSGVKVVSVDMPPFMQVHAVDCARKTYDSLEKFTSMTLAFTLKKEFDGVYGPAWHCIVGTSFGSFVTHSVGGFLYFSMDHKHYILLFKTTVQKAD